MIKMKPYITMDFEKLSTDTLNGLKDSLRKLAKGSAGFNREANTHLNRIHGVLYRRAMLNELITGG